MSQESVAQSDLPTTAETAARDSENATTAATSPLDPHPTWTPDRSYYTSQQTNLNEPSSTSATPAVLTKQGHRDENMFMYGSPQQVEPQEKKGRSSLWKIFCIGVLLIAVVLLMKLVVSRFLKNRGNDGMQLSHETGKNTNDRLENQSRIYDTPTNKHNPVKENTNSSSRRDPSSHSTSTQDKNQYVSQDEFYRLLVHFEDRLSTLNDKIKHLSPASITDESDQNSPKDNKEENESNKQRTETTGSYPKTMTYIEESDDDDDDDDVDDEEDNDSKNVIGINTNENHEYKPATYQSWTSSDQENSDVPLSSSVYEFAQFVTGVNPTNYSTQYAKPPPPEFEEQNEEEEEGEGKEKEETSISEKEGEYTGNLHEDDQKQTEQTAETEFFPSPPNITSRSDINRDDSQEEVNTMRNSAVSEPMDTYVQHTHNNDARRSATFDATGENVNYL